MNHSFSFTPFTKRICRVRHQNEMGFACSEVRVHWHQSEAGPIIKGGQKRPQAKGGLAIEASLVCIYTDTYNMLFIMIIYTISIENIYYNNSCNVM